MMGSARTLRTREPKFKHAGADVDADAGLRRRRVGAHVPFFAFNDSDAAQH